MKRGNRHEATGNSKKVKVFGFALSTLLLALCGFGEAQQSTKIPRIGFLSGGIPTTNATRHEAFRQGLRELGYVEGKTSSSSIDTQK